MLAVRFSIFVWAVGTLAAQHAYTPADIQEGGRLFRENCVLCHGPEGDQIPGIDLVTASFARHTRKRRSIKIIQERHPGHSPCRPQPADFQAENHAGVLALNRPSGRAVTGNGDAARGKAIFEGKGGCAGLPSCGDDTARALGRI